MVKHSPDKSIDVKLQFMVNRVAYIRRCPNAEKNSLNRFIHETSDVTNEEIQYMEAQINMLNKTEVPFDGGILNIKQTLLLQWLTEKSECSNRDHINN